ncbi:MAG: Na(+)/H(+) antiporter subunit G [candidate division WS2 bacterium]|nr:Na(+)/H(+) antiporter subunit G [Candidatus Psychracetigena formicireducens]MBT9138278.1 Na(+)/H(+) antiporter subunit G [Bacillota bacterium]MBT9150702.1 Na(+)/H(+) antiporter subunit G [Candidatus Psychracetigena formicireducens]
MSVLITFVTAILMLLGILFFLVGAIALIRFPDVYSRLHATTKLDTLGLGFILIGLIVYEGFSLADIKLAFIIFFVFITSPTAAHALARAAYKSGVKLWGKNPVDRYGESKSGNF